MDMKKMKVLSPIAGKDGNKTFWARAGTAYENKDGSINIYLDLLPTNGKLQLRELDEPDRRGHLGALSPPSSPSSSSFEGGAVARPGHELPF